MSNRRTYYVGDGEVTSGPFSLREVRVFLAHRKGLDDRFLIRRAEEHSWHPVAELSEFNEIFGPRISHSTVPASPRAKRQAS